MPAIGVTYGPTGPPAPHPTIQRLQSLNVAWVRIQWVDLTSTIRYRVLPISYFAKVLATERPAVSLTKATLGLVFVSVADGFGGTGEYAYVFDLESTRPCSYAPGHASIMGWFQEKFPSPSYDIDICPRTLLKRIVGEAKATSGVDFLVGFETEFILLKKDSQPVNEHGWSCSSALSSGSVESTVLEEIAAALIQDGVELQMYHAEGAPGQYEVVTGPLPPLQAADALIHTRETIYNIANKHGLRATLAPRVVANSCGSGQHVHISVHSDDKLEQAGSSWPGVELRSSEASFLAGVIAHLPALCPITLPRTASYDRMKDGIWSGGTYASWGVEHRETPVRVCNHASPLSRNFEMRMMDGSSNPYLALSAVLGVGWADGIKVGRKLTQRPLMTHKSAFQLSDAERADVGIDTRLPRTLQEAQKALEEDSLVVDLLGRGFVNAYLSVNRFSNESFDHPDPAEARRLLLAHW